MIMIAINDLQKGSIVMYQGQPVVIIDICTNHPSPPYININQRAVEINELKPALLKDILCFFKYDSGNKIYSNNVSFIDTHIGIHDGNAVIGLTSDPEYEVIVPYNKPVHLIQKQHVKLLTLW